MAKLQPVSSYALKEFCDGRRGRASAIAKLLGVSREFIRQVSVSSRPAPHDMSLLLGSAMRAVEAFEKKTYAEALKRVREGVQD